MYELVIFSYGMGYELLVRTWYGIRTATRLIFFASRSPWRHRSTTVASARTARANPALSAGTTRKHHAMNVAGIVEGSTAFGTRLAACLIERPSGDNAINDHAAQHYKSHFYKRLVSRRANYIRNELQAAPMVIYSDIDSVWLKDPTASLSEDDVDMWGQKDGDRSWGTYFCTGLIAFRQTKASLEFLEMWDEALLENPQLNQPIFNRLIGDHPDLLKTVTLPFSKFPNGALYFGGTFKGEVMDNKEDVYIVHNNFIEGHENKVGRFKAHGLWSEQ